MMSTFGTPRGMTRRHFVSHLAGTAIALPATQFMSALAAQGAQVRANQKHCILLWMGGGPSHLDTWDLKPESENGGEFRPIATSASGVKISEHLPTVARQMQHLSIVRSLNSKEGNHDRGTYVMHTGYQPNPTVVHPSFGSICSYELGHKAGSDFALPHVISIGAPGEGAGFLGMSHAPFFIQSPTAPIENMRLPDGVNDSRMLRRLRMLELAETDFAKQKRGQAAVDHTAVYDKTVRMMNSQFTPVFNLDDEPAALRDAYGRNDFGQGCLLARRLVQAGVTFVEVTMGGWDNHNDIFSTLRRDKLPQLDAGMGTLVADLARLGMLENTLVVWMGEFGRTPRINQNGGRDHWPRGWSVVLGGGGIKGGQVVGATDKDGVEIVDRELGVMDIIGTMSKAIGIDVNTQYTTPNGRPMKVVDGGKPISELI